VPGLTSRSSRDGVATATGAAGVGTATGAGAGAASLSGPGRTPHGRRERRQGGSCPPPAHGSSSSSGRGDCRGGLPIFWHKLGYLVYAYDYESTSINFAPVFRWARMGCGQHRAFLLGSDRLPSDSQSWRRLNLDRDGTFSIPHLRPSSCWLLAAALATALAAALHQCGVEVCRCAETIIPWARISWMRLRNSVASRLTAIPSAPATASTYYNISPRPHYRHLRIGRGDFFSSRIHLTFEANSQYLSFLMLEA
jgi:hypothetical protein